MKRFIVNKKHLHIIEDRKYLDGAKTMESTDIIKPTDNLDFLPLEFVAITLTDVEQKAFENAGIEISEADKPQNAILGRFDGLGTEHGKYVPTGNYPFVETGFNKYDNRGITGKNVRIGLPDTGGNTFAPSIVPNFGVNFTSADPSYADNYGHGGRMFGQIKSTVWGTAPGSILHIMKTINDAGAITGAYFLAAVSYAIAQQLHMVNMSFQYITTPGVVQSSIDALVAAKCLPICAAGNGGSGAYVITPACCNGAIAVGGADVNRTVWSGGSNVAGFQGTGHGIDILAPANLVPYGGINGENHGGIGSSFSPPYVIGAVAAQIEQFGMTSLDAWKVVRANALSTGNTIHGAGFLNCP